MEKEDEGEEEEEEEQELKCDNRSPESKQSDPCLKAQVSFPREHRWRKHIFSSSSSASVLPSVEQFWRQALNTTRPP